MDILGYKYNSETEAENARKLCADYHGLPVSPDSVTKYFVDYNYSNDDNFWYITWIDGCTEVLGTPYNFTMSFQTM